MRPLLALALVAVAALCANSLRTPTSLATGSATIAVDASAVEPGPQATGLVGVTSPEFPIDIDIQNADGVGAFEFEIIYEPLYLVFTRWTPGPFLASTGRSASCQQVVQATTIHIGCGTPGTPSPAGPSGGGVLATLYFRPKAMGETCLLMTQSGTSDVLGNSLPTLSADGCLTIVSSTLDTDGDGCPDGLEAGISHVYGGDRNAYVGWDFFDVPVPALNPGNTSGHRDGSVGISDVISILAYIGTGVGRGPNANGVSYGTDLDADGVPDGQEYDRTPSVDNTKPWRSGPPDGSVSIKDAMVELNQIGDRCLIPL